MEQRILPILAILAMVVVSGCVSEGEPEIGEETNITAEPSEPAAPVVQGVRQGDWVINLDKVETTKLYPPRFHKNGYRIFINVTNMGAEDATFPYDALLTDQGGYTYEQVVYHKAVSGTIPAGETQYGDIRVWDVPVEATELTLTITSGTLTWTFEVL